MTTSNPAFASAGITSGTRPTRRSPGYVSFGTPIITRSLLHYRAPANGSFYRSCKPSGRGLSVIDHGDGRCASLPDRTNYGEKEHHSCRVSLRTGGGGRPDESAWGGIGARLLIAPENTEDGGITK